MLRGPSSRSCTARARFKKASGDDGSWATTATRLTVLAFLHDFSKLNTGFQFQVGVGGEHPNSATSIDRLSGSSPRGRGTQDGRGFGSGCCRIIPAWAGNTTGEPVFQPHLPDHPRVGGEHDIEVWNGVRIDGIIPAWAGNTATRAARSSNSPDHPRVGGEHCASPAMPWPIPGSSPRGRGTRRRRGRQPSHCRIIPAWAGNT